MSLGVGVSVGISVGVSVGVSVGESVGVSVGVSVSAAHENTNGRVRHEDKDTNATRREELQQTTYTYNRQKNKETKDNDTACECQNAHLDIKTKWCLGTKCKCKHILIVLRDGKQTNSVFMNTHTTQMSQSLHHPKPTKTLM